MIVGKRGKSIHFAEHNILMVLIVLVAVLSLANDRFLTYANITNLLRQTSIIGVMAVGVTFVILSGGIDLSVGSVLALSSIVASLMMRSGVSVFLAIVSGLVCGTAAGLLMGVVIHEGKVPPFIATLGGLTIFKGIVMLLSGARKVIGLPQGFIDFAVARVLGIPAMVIVWILTIVAGLLMSRYTIFGRQVYAIGSNREAARLSGINIRLTIYKIYAFCGFTSAIAGIIMTARLGGGSPTGGTGYEMDAIAAVVLGGASLNGAVGSILGTLIGTVIIATIKNGGNLLGIDPFVLDIIIGALIVLAVMFDQLRKKD